MDFRSILTLTLAVALLGLVPDLSAAASPKGKPPTVDLTKGGQPDDTHDWTLGPTGARGWMWGWRNHTTDARQILVTKVDAGSPAEKLLAVGDVILGVNANLFSSDARIEFGRAISQAEKTRNRGLLRLIRWRKGKQEDITLTLKVMGTYSTSAPYGCEKSKAIFELGCQAIAKKRLSRVSIDNDFNALALLASGKKEYLPMLAQYAKLVDKSIRPPQWWWHYGYANLFLAEYYLVTKDQSIFPALKEKTLEIARFQSAVGTWGHEHKLTEGRLHGYGAMNQVGLILNMSMVIARKAGVKDPIVDKAIAKSATIMRWYVGKGSLPYGDHQPWMDHEDNGKNSMGAILYDLLGDREATTFFSRMATAAHAERENGHTGNFFNITWALMGVSRSGPYATGAYFHETAWYYDLARRWDGSFGHQGIPGQRGDSYRKWDCTGAFILAYALPLKSLYITGKSPSSASALSYRETKSIINDGRNFTFWDRGTSYDDMSDEQLLERLSSWSPIVRSRAASSLAHHESDFTASLVKMLGSNDANAQYGACAAIALLGSRADGTASKLTSLLSSDDPWLLHQAVTALSFLDEPARKEITPVILKLAVRNLKTDPRRRAQRAVTRFLFSRPRGGPKGVFAESLAYDDPPALVAAMASILTNDDGRTRGELTNIFRLLKDDKQLAPHLPAILKSTQISSPSGIMFADNIRMAGLELLSRMRIRDGMAMCIEQMDPDRWKQDQRVPRCLDQLKRYGGNARPLLPKLREVQEQMRKRRGDQKRKAALMAKFDQVIKAIEEDMNPPKLRSAQEIIDAAKV
jgi:hypothetical protein